MFVLNLVTRLLAMFLIGVWLPREICKENCGVVGYEKIMVVCFLTFCGCLSLNRNTHETVSGNFADLEIINVHHTYYSPNLKGRLLQFLEIHRELTHKETTSSLCGTLLGISGDCFPKSF